MDDQTFIREQRDRHLIQEALRRYFWGIDRGNHALRFTAFAPGGIMEIAGVQNIGPLAPNPDDFPPPAGVPPREQIHSFDHHLHHSEIRFEGDEAFAATNATAYLLVDRGQGREMLVRGVRYHDHFVRVGDDWGIKERIHIVDWMYVAPAEIGNRTSERENFDDFVRAKMADRLA